MDKQAREIEQAVSGAEVTRSRRKYYVSFRRGMQFVLKPVNQH